VGNPRLVGNMFGDDRGEVSPLSLSFLYATNDGRDPRELMDQWLGLGGEACRWFASKLTPSDTRSGQSLADSEARAPQMAQWIRERGLIGHAVGFCDTASWNSWNDFEPHARWFGQFLRDHPWLIGEAVNEIDHESQVGFTIDDLNRIVRWIREGFSGPLTAGAWLKSDELVDGKYKPAEVKDANVIDTHFERTNEPAWDMSNHGFSELRVIQETYGSDSARMSGEPKRTDDGPVWPPQVFAYLLGVEAQGFNTWSTMHCTQARDVQKLQGEQLKDAQHFLRGGKLLPRGRYHFENSGWGGSPIKGAAFVEGPSTSPGNENVWRIHSYRHEATGQWFAVVSGPKATEPHVEFQNGFEFDKVIDQLDQYVVVHTLKQ
jgi:hypothetical protein